MSTTEERLDRIKSTIKTEVMTRMFYEGASTEAARHHADMTVRYIEDDLQSLLSLHTQRAEDIRIMGKSVEEIMVILRALEIERITEIEVTMKNLDALYERLRNEMWKANQKAINRAFAQPSSKDTDKGLLNRLADLRKDKGTFPTGTWTFNPQELLDFIHVDRETAVRGALDIRKFAKDTMDIDLTSYQMETITKLANGWDERGYPEIAFGGRMIGRSALMMTLGKYLQRSIQDHQISQSLEDRV